MTRAGGDIPTTSILTLIRLFAKSAEMYLPEKKSYRILAGAAILGIMVPCTVVVGVLSYVMTEAMIEVGNYGGGMLFEMQILSAFSMIFGIMVIYSILFFSSDREHLVTLPIPSHTFMMAKFLYAYVAESAMEFLILAAVYVGYFLSVGINVGVKEALNPVGIIAALIGVFLIPLIPMIYGALFSLVLTAALKQVKSARVFQSMSTVFLMIFGGLFLYSLRGIGRINVENYVESLVRGDNFLFRALNFIFFPVPWLAEAVSAGSIPYLLLYLAGNVLLVAALYFTGKALYREGLYTVAALGSSKKAGIKEADLKPLPPFWASLQKELRVILRTQAFANNTAYVNLLWPFGTFLLFHYTNGKEGAISKFIALHQAGKERADLTLVMIILTLAFIATALNSLASTAFTREGKHLALIKYIPVPYETQLYAKAAVSFLFTYPPLLLTDIILCLYVGVPFVMGAIYAVFLLLAHLIAMVVGIWLDSTKPYVEWDDEYSALRGNINVFFNLAVMMLVSAAVIGICFLLYELVKLPIMVFYGVVFFVLALTAVLLIAKGEKKILENMENLG